MTIPIQMRYFRGLLWLAIAIVVAWAFWHYGAQEYVERWTGGLAKAATGVWGGYRVSKGICRIDPSMGRDGLECGLLHLSRVILISAMVLAICLAV